MVSQFRLLFRATVFPWAIFLEGYDPPSIFRGYCCLSYLEHLEKQPGTTGQYRFFPFLQNLGTPSLPCAVKIANSIRLKFLHSPSTRMYYSVILIHFSCEKKSPQAIQQSSMPTTLIYCIPTFCRITFPIRI